MFSLAEAPEYYFFFSLFLSLEEVVRSMIMALIAGTINIKTLRSNGLEEGIILKGGWEKDLENFVFLVYNIRKIFKAKAKGDKFHDRITRNGNFCAESRASTRMRNKGINKKEKLVNVNCYTGVL